MLAGERKIGVNNKVIDKEAIHNFVDGLNVDDSIKKELKQITPQNYTGIF